jgi:Protein of unknown function (DUF2726)
MYWVFIIIAIAIALSFAAAANKKRLLSDADVSYVARDSLFTPAERSFFGALENAVGDQFRVFGKVRIADVINVKSASNKTWQSAFNRISAKHFDFVVCERTTTRVVCAVELDDQSHKRRARVARDELVDAVCNKSGLPLLRIQAQAAYNIRDISAKLNALVVKEPSATGKLA